MSQDSKPTTTEDLRRLTGAPRADEPLVSDTEFPTRVVPTERPPWTLPIPKLGVIGAALLPVFILAASVLVNRGQSKQTAQSETVNPTQTTANFQSEATLTQLQAENAKLKADAALDGQKALASKPTAPRSKPVVNRQPPKLSQKAVTQPTESIQRVTQPTSIASVPTPWVRRVPITSSPQPIKSPPSLPRQPEIDPSEQWQQLAKLGSYGSIAPEQPATVASPQLVQARALRQSAVRMERNAEEAADLTSTVEVSELSDRAISDEVIAEEPILENSETRILDERSKSSSLIAGTTSTGVVTAPIVLDGKERNSSPSDTSPNRFSIVLSTPLKTATGEVAFPAGTRLLAQVDELMNTGRVELSATTAVWTEAGQQKEVRLPVGVIQIRGENGKPLMAEESRNRKREMTRMQAGQFLLGAVQRSAGLLTRSNSQIQTGNGTTIITEKNPRPNILAGALEGGATQLLETMNERNQQAIADLQNKPEVHVIQVGQPVEIFVNQSMLLPTFS